MEKLSLCSPSAMTNSVPVVVHSSLSRRIFVPSGAFMRSVGSMLLRSIESSVFFAWSMRTVRFSFLYASEITEILCTPVAKMMRFL